MHFVLRAKIFVVATIGISLVLCQSVFGEARQTPVSTQRVILFSSGVGYFEHAGTVKGNSSVELRFKTEQINDILKSLVLEDLDGGKAGVVVYPSQDPVAKTLRSFQVDISENPSLPALLNQIRGVKIKATVHGEEISGSILGVEAKQKAVGEKEKVIDVWVLNIISGANIRSVSLDDVQKLEIEDSQLQVELNKALTTVALERDKGKKPVTMNFVGQGERRVRFGYVVETPVWKTSYRLILSDVSKDKSHLQGWAIVENQTENDWNNIELSLISGRPISFIYNLYQPLYIPRQLVQPELYTSLRPQTYEAGIGLAQEEEAEQFAATDEVSLAEEKLAARKMEKAKDFAAAPVMGGIAAKPLIKKPMEPIHSIASVADAGQIGELFQYTVGNVSLPRQQSAMIPIIAGDIQAERISIYNQGVIEKKGDKDKVIIIEHPFRLGWKLSDSPKPIETTDRLYRFKDSVGPGKTAKLIINEEMIQSDTIAILPADFGQLEFYSRSGKIPQKVRDALVKAMELKKSMLDTQRKISDKQKEVSEITQEQQRIRENMKTVNQKSQYYSRLLTKLNEQETKIEKLQVQTDQLKETYEKQRKDLEEY